MNKSLYLLALVLASCQLGKEEQERIFTEVSIEHILQDTVSIRAIRIMGEDVAFAGSSGVYGIYDASKQDVKLDRQAYNGTLPDFRAVASTAEDFFMLSVASPALLYKTGDSGAMELVYKEEFQNTFYDAMVFWNNREGIAMGDPVENCLSVIITRDGGNTWKKLPCTTLPEVAEGEAAFAASNSNIAVVGDETWMISGGTQSRVFYSPDKGKNWKVFETPLVSGGPTKGAYSLDFYNSKRGIIIGGDYKAPEENTSNKAVTEDGGRTWKLVGQGKGPGYKSSIRFVPGSDAREVVAVGFTGISYSSDSGKTWKTLSDEGFYTLRFLNDSVAYAAGKNKLARLNFN